MDSIYGYRAAKKRCIEQVSFQVEYEVNSDGRYPVSLAPDITHLGNESTANQGINHFQSQRTAPDELICFGMIPAIPGHCERRGPCPATLPVILESSERFGAEGFDIKGKLKSEYGHMMHGLLEEKTLSLYTICSFDLGSISKRSSTLFMQIPCSLQIVVYGPYELFESIGSWFQDYDIYLQDPRHYSIDARYCNPQMLSSDDPQSCPWVSEVVSRLSGAMLLQDITDRPDLLDILSSQNELEEAMQPGMIRALLHRHQRQALTFMMRRERGWMLDSKDADIWETSDTGQGRYFINRVSDTHQMEAPEQFYGGIVADPMGLGKTLTMIALVANDLERVKDFEDAWASEDRMCAVQATLIIVPQPLLGTWEEQLSQHVMDGGLRFCRHHGKTRLKEVADIDSVNVVLTTYHTLSADWKASKSGGSHAIFNVCWKRIVLDEAHVIRNSKSRMSRAICDLDAISRWAVTGTPIQNNLSDLAALLKFIRAHPYDDPKRFETDVSRLWKTGEDEEAVKRLKRLAHCLILRRSKRTIDLPPRRDMNCPIEFSKAERALYDEIRQRTITKLDDVLLHGSELSTSGVYVNFLQQIESMRLVCNLGIHYTTRHDKPMTQDVLGWKSIAQETFNIHRDMEPISCSQCSASLDVADTLFDTSSQEMPQFSRCLKFACAECSHKLRLTGHKMVCGHTPRCPVAPVSINHSAFEETLSQLSRPAAASSIELPSKVNVLVADLKALPLDVKSIVFSTWRLTLDITEAGLTQAGVRSVRFDGKVPQTQRQSVLNQFKTDPSIRVMLLTLSCGAVGLTLTEASRAYLMEPHWNPTIEEQALARIHRIGQKREVTTVRFFIRDSFEERVMEVQESKKNLAGVLLSGHDGGHADDSLGALQRLRSLL